MSKTHDRAPHRVWIHDSAFHTETQLSANKGLTPEGFLVCEGVPIARTGLMSYGEGEIYSGDEFLEGDSRGVIMVTRDENEVFNPRTIASFEGKSITDDHPDDGVLPANFRELEVGTVHQVRRGEGTYSDCLIADLIIKDPEAIKAVQDGKIEVSCGYDADYEQSEPGRARQFNIIGNHVALVDRGRCGPRCSIGDKAMRTLDKKPSVLDRIKSAFKASTAPLTADAALKIVQDAEKEDKEDEGEKSTKDAITALQKTVDNLPAAIAAALHGVINTRDAGDDDDEEEDMTEDDAPEGETAEEKAARLKKDKTEDKAGKTMDAATMTGVIQAVKAHAEILAPGVQLSIPTADAKLTRMKFADSMCNCKRKALDVAYRTEDGRKLIEPFLQGRTADFAHIPAKTIDVIFTGAALMRAAQNNGAAGTGLRAGITKDDFGAAPLTIDSLNKRHQEFWGAQGGAKK